MRTVVSIAYERDARVLAELRTRVAQDMTREFGEGHWSACPSQAEVLRQLRASRVLIAHRDAEVIGTVRLARALPWAIDSGSFTPVGAALYVLGLAVSPDTRGQGVGRQLIDAAKQALRSWPADALWLDAYDHAAGVGAFYEACGFRLVGPSSRGEVPLIYYEWLTAPGS